MSNQTLKILHLEDADVDYELIGRELKRGGLEFERRRATDRESFIEKLNDLDVDLILSDFSLPTFDGLQALELAIEHAPELPFIFVTGAVGEERAVDLLKKGATDYIIKDRLQRLVPAVLRAKEEAEARREQRKAEESKRYREQLKQVINRFSVNYVSVGGSALDEAINSALGELGFFIGADRSYLYMLSEGEAEVAQTHVWRRAGIEMREKESRVVINKFHWAMRQLRDLRTICANGPEDLPDEAVDESRFMRIHELESLLLVPIAPLGTLTGFLGCESHRENGWTDETITLLRVAGEVFGNALLRAKSEEELREEREFLQNLLDFTEAVIIVVDERGQLLQVNDGFTKVTGFSHEEVIGRSMFDLLIPEELHEHARSDLELTLEQGRISDYEVPVMTQGSGRRSIRWKAVVSSNNGAVQIVASGIDLTDLRESQKSRLRLEAQLAHAERIESLGRVAAKITHEFNNVLMGIQPFAEIVGMRAGDDKRLQTSAERIKQSIARGSNITREVLRFARSYEPVRQRITVCDWLDELVNAHRIVLGEGVSASVRCARDHVVMVDRSQVDQVLINLLVNARDAMDGEGEIEIIVSSPPPDSKFDFGVVPEPDRYLHIEVRDDGPGIPADIIEDIFEPFYTTKQKGTGLGLAISQQILHAHEGQMFVQSEPGRGASFHLFLPKAADRFAEQSAAVGRELTA